MPGLVCGILNEVEREEEEVVSDDADAVSEEGDALPADAEEEAGRRRRLSSRRKRRLAGEDGLEEEEQNTVPEQICTHHTNCKTDYEIDGTVYWITCPSQEKVEA